MESELGGVKVLWHQYFTNKIAYVKLAFDMSHVPMNLVPYASFLAEILTIVDTTNYSYQEMRSALRQVESVRQWMLCQPMFMNSCQCLS